MPPSSDAGKDAIEIIAAIIGEAHLAADLTAAFLEAIGFLPPRDERPPDFAWSLPTDLLLEIGTMMRLYQLERAGVLPHIRVPLPHSTEVLDDVIERAEGRPGKFTAAQLGPLLLRVTLAGIAWQRLGNRAADVAVVQACPAEDVVDQLARVLWNFRHLNHEGGNDDCTS